MLRASSIIHTEKNKERNRGCMMHDKGGMRNTAGRTGFGSRKTGARNQCRIKISLWYTRG
jgi:hypothetical protein